MVNISKFIVPLSLPIHFNLVAHALKIQAGTNGLVGRDDSTIEATANEHMSSTNTPLSVLHAGCDSATRSRTPDCMAAMHRYCNSTYRKGTAAYPQEVTPSDIRFFCADALWKKDVTLANVPECANGNSQSAACYYSAYRWCDYIGYGGIGIPQEAPPGDGAVTIACVSASFETVIPAGRLEKYHSGCTAPSLAQTPDCAAAVHRYCENEEKMLGGVVIEGRRAELVTIACVSASNATIFVDAV